MGKKYFIDLGAFTGDTIATAKVWYPNFDQYIGFEPLPEHFQVLTQTFANDSSVELINAAADVQEGEAVLFRGNSSGQSGGSLCQKTNCLTDNSITVKTVDLSGFLKARFTPDDHVVLKCDIEGKEYDVLPSLVDSGAIHLVDELFCEWHYDRVGVSEAAHKHLVDRLNGFGFGLTGNNSLDEFHFVAKDWADVGKMKYALTKGWPKTKLRMRYGFPVAWGVLTRIRNSLAFSR